MCHSIRFRLFASCLAAAAAAVSFLVLARPARSAEEPARSRAIYHADPEHLWNRLHEALFVRIGPDGRTYGQDRLEPLLWPESKYIPEWRSDKRRAPS